MSDGIFDSDYISIGFAKYLVWEMPYDNDLLAGYQASVLSYNFSLPGDQYRIDIENETVSAILLSNQTSLSTGADGQFISNETTIKPLYANRLLTNSTLYIFVEPGIAVLAIEGFAELQGDIIEEDNNPAVFIFAKDGFKISNATFRGFSEVYLIASSIHDNFSLEEQQNLTTAKLHRYFQLYSFGDLSNIIINGFLNTPSTQKLNLYASSLGCNGLIENDNLEIYLNSEITPTFFNCSINANSFEFISVIAPIEMAASIKAENVIIASNNNITTSGIIEATDILIKTFSNFTNHGSLIATNRIELGGSLFENYGKITTNHLSTSSQSFYNKDTGSLIVTGTSTIKINNLGEFNRAATSIYVHPLFINVLSLNENGLEFVSEDNDVILLSYENEDKLLLANEFKFSPNIKGAYFFAKNGFEIRNFTTSSLEHIYFIASSFTEYSQNHGVISFDKEAFNNFIFNKALKSISISSGFNAPNTNVKYFASKAEFKDNLDANALDGYISQEEGIIPEPIYLDGTVIKTELFKLNIPYKAVLFYLRGVIEANDILVTTLGNFTNLGSLTATNRIELGGSLFENYATISSNSLIIQSTNILNMNSEQITVTGDYLWIGKDIDGNYVGVWDDSTNIIKAGGKTIFIGKTFSLTKKTEFNKLELDIRAGEAFRFHNSKVKGKTIIKVTNSNLDLGSLIFENDAEISTDSSFFFNGYNRFTKDAYLYGYHAHLNPGAVIETGQTLLFKLTATDSQLNLNKGSSITTNILSVVNNNNGWIGKLNMASGSIKVHGDAHLSIGAINLDRAEKAVIETPWSPNPNALSDCLKPAGVKHPHMAEVGTKCGYWASTCADPLILRQKDTNGGHYHPKNCEAVIHTFFKWYSLNYKHWTNDVGVSAQYFLDTFQGSDASKFDIAGSAHFDVGQLNVNIANFKIGKYISVPKDLIPDIRNTLITLSKKAYIIDNGAYWGSDAYDRGHYTLEQQSAINLAGILATATQRVSALYQSPYTSVPSTVDMGTCIEGSGKFNIINGEITVKYGADTALLPQSRLDGNQLISSSGNNQLVTAYSLNGADKIIVGATVNPNQPVKPIDMLIFATTDIKDSMFSYNHKRTISKALPDTNADQIRYLYQRDYQSLYSCEYGIETIIEKLGLDPKIVGLILADQTDQLQIIMKALTQKTGYSRFAEFEIELAKVIKDGNIPAMKETCESIKWLIENAIEIKSKLKFGELKMDNLHEITKSFLWLVYNHYPIDPNSPEGNSVKVLEPVVYIPLTAAQNAKSRDGASLTMGGKININTAISSGALYFKGGTDAKIGNLASFGKVQKDGDGDVSLEITGKAIFASAVQTTLSLAEASAKPFLGLGGVVSAEESERSLVATVGQEVTPAKLTDQNSHMEVGSTRLTHASVINTGNGIFNIKLDNTPVIAGTRIDGGKGGVSFDAKNDISFLPAQLFYSSGICEGDNFHCIRSLQNVRTSMAGNIQVNAEGVTIAGVDGTALEALKVKSTSGEIHYLPVYDLYYEETKTTTEKDGGWFGADKTYISHKKYFRQDPKVDQIGTEVQPAIQVISESHGDTKIVGLIVHSVNYVVKAGTPDHKANIYIDPAIKIDSSYQFEQVIKDGLSFSGGKIITHQEKTITDSKETNTAKMPEFHSYGGGGVLDAGGKIEIKAGQDFMVDHKEGKVTITALDGIDITAVPEVVQTTLHEETSKKESMGFEASFEEVCFAVTKSERHSKSYTIVTHTTPVDIKGKISEIISNNGELNTKGVNVQNALITVLKHLDQPAYDTVEHSMDSLYTELKTKTGFVNNFAKALDKTMAIANSDGSINKGFAAYAAYAAWLRAVANPIKFDVSVSMKIEKEKVSINEMTVVASIFSGTTDVKASKMHYVGTEFRGLDATFKGDELIMEAAFSSYEQSREGKCKSITASFASQSVIGKLSNIDHELDQKNAKNVKVELSGTYTVETTGKTELKGIEVNAANIKINVGSLLVKSIQSIIKKYGDENHLGIGTSFLEGKVKPLLDEIGFMHERGSKLWIDGLTKLIARDKVEIIVNGMFHIAGAMVANAVVDENGQYKDGGKLSIKAAEMLAENIKGYDNGELLGASLSLSATDDGIFGNEYGLSAGFKALHQLVKPTIGKGNIEVGKSSGEINRDLDNPIETDGVKIDPIHAYYQSIDLEKLGESLEQRNTIERTFDSFKNVGEQVRSWYYKATGAEDPRKAETLDPKEVLRTADNELIDEILDLEEEAKAEEVREEKEANDMENLLKRKPGDKEQQQTDKKNKDSNSNEPVQKSKAKTYDDFEDEEVIDLDDPKYDVLTKPSKKTKYNANGYFESIGPNDPLQQAYNEANAKIDSMPIAEYEKQAARNDIKKVLEMSDKQKAELANAIKEKYKEKSVWEKLNPFKIENANAAEPVAIVMTCAANPTCVSAILALSGATYLAVQDAIKETTTFFDKKTVEKGENKAYTKQPASSSENGNPEEDPDDQDDSKSKMPLDLEKEIIKLKESKLLDHEGGDHNGHTLDTHVGRTEEFLKTRLTKESLKDASSYKDYETAEMIIKRIIEKKIKKISRWYANEKMDGTEQFSTSFEDVVGYGIKKGESTITPKNKAMVILQKTKEGIKIITSHPID